MLTKAGSMPAPEPGMTEELFREEPYRTQAEAAVLAIDARGIVLDRTNFYPRGGGQAGDAGALAPPGGSVIAI
ncbi:MAG: alanine--tRNA ligase-related protein, partial [Usitatibacter sp.]